MPVFNNSGISVCKSDVCRGRPAKTNSKLSGISGGKTRNLSDAHDVMYRRIPLTTMPYFNDSGISAFKNESKRNSCVSANPFKTPKTQNCATPSPGVSRATSVYALLMASFDLTGLRPLLLDLLGPNLDRIIFDLFHTAAAGRVAVSPPINTIIKAQARFVHAVHVRRICRCRRSSDQIPEIIAKIYRL